MQWKNENSNEKWSNLVLNSFNSNNKPAFGQSHCSHIETATSGLRYLLDGAVEGPAIGSVAKNSLRWLESAVELPQYFVYQQLRKQNGSMIIKKQGSVTENQGGKMLTLKTKV